MEITDHEYSQSLALLAERASQLWGLDQGTSINLDAGNAMQIVPLESGAAALRFHIYDPLDSPAQGESLDVFGVAIMEPADPRRVCFEALKRLPLDIATRRRSTVLRATAYLAGLSHDRAA